MGVWDIISQFLSPPDGRQVIDKDCQFWDAAVFYFHKKTRLILRRAFKKNHGYI